MNKIIYLDAAASALKPESVIETEGIFLKKQARRYCHYLLPCHWLLKLFP